MEVLSDEDKLIKTATAQLTPHLKLNKIIKTMCWQNCAKVLPVISVLR